MGKSRIAIVGAGLAGAECALALAARGVDATIFEQKPAYRSAAHQSDSLAELVCSNSLRSDSPRSAPGLLKEETRALGGVVMEAADATRVPAGKSLAVDREAFSKRITERLLASPRLTVRRKKVESLDDEELRSAGEEGIVVACGPMGDEALINDLARIAGEENCYFYDAIAPIVWSESLDHSRIFRASRYDEEGDGDYLNAPMNKEEYENFRAALLAGRVFAPREFEKETHFEGCMPIEELARRGPQTLAHGPLKPVGLIDPATGRRPWAVLQLRAETNNLSAFNLVGCQTKLLQGEQEKAFRLVPGMERVEFARYGSMHRNAFVNAPKVLAPDLSLKKRPGVYLAGQIAGVEGYLESAAIGLWLGLTLAARLAGKYLPPPPEETALGSLLAHLRRETKRFQPSNATFGLMPDLERRAGKRDRKEAYSERAREAFKNWLKDATGAALAARGDY